MLQEYKGDNYYKSFIGKCFEMSLTGTGHSAVKVLRFENREFIVEECYLDFGIGKITNGIRKYCFVNSKNYVEISENNYNSIRYLAKHTRKYDVTNEELK